MDAGRIDSTRATFGAPPLPRPDVAWAPPRRPSPAAPPAHTDPIPAGAITPAAPGDLPYPDYLERQNRIRSAVEHAPRPFEPTGPQRRSDAAEFTDAGSVAGPCRSGPGASSAGPTNAGIKIGGPTIGGTKIGDVPPPGAAAPCVCRAARRAYAPPAAPRPGRLVDVLM